MTVDTTIITCVEAGSLETQVLMLAESLRAFGGTWGKSNFIAVKPRRGPRISSSTLQQFRRLGVEFIDEKFNVVLDWWNNANKSAVLSQLETRVSTPYITWMDGDMIVLQALDELLPGEGADFIARAGEGYLGSDGSDDNALYWHKLCGRIGIDFNDFPFIYSFPEQRRIHAYWQTGIYTYAINTRLGRAHYEIIRNLLSSKIASRTAGIYHQDQVSISLAVQKLRLVHSEFAAPMNFNINPLSKANATILPMSKVKVLHYHGALYPETVDWAMSFIEHLPSDRIELIRKYVPLLPNASLRVRVINRILRAIRQKQVNRIKNQSVEY
jgi:hypothetical protein